MEHQHTNIQHHSGDPLASVESVSRTRFSRSMSDSVIGGFEDRDSTHVCVVDIVIAGFEDRIVLIYVWHIYVYYLK